jgi:hypothetical protein
MSIQKPSVFTSGAPLAPPPAAAVKQSDYASNIHSVGGRNSSVLSALSNRSEQKVKIKLVAFSSHARKALRENKRQREISASREF